MRENGILLMVILMSLGGNEAEGLLCYRCDTWNQGDTCETTPASKHIRNFGVDEQCLSFEDANNQYLALQKDVAPEWYFSVLNGDHGIPFNILKRAASEGGILSNYAGGQVGSSAMLDSDRDSACIYIRSFFMDSLDEASKTSTVLWFRKCIKLPALDHYPACGEGNIYRGSVEMCVCRSDRCNFNRMTDESRDGVITGVRVSISSSSRPYSEIYLSFVIIFLKLL